MIDRPPGSSYTTLGVSSTSYPVVITKREQHGRNAYLRRACDRGRTQCLIVRSYAKYDTFMITVQAGLPKLACNTSADLVP